MQRRVRSRPSANSHPYLRKIKSFISSFMFPEQDSDDEEEKLPESPKRPVEKPVSPPPPLPEEDTDNVRATLTEAIRVKKAFTQDEFDYYIKLMKVNAEEKTAPMDFNTLAQETFRTETTNGFKPSVPPTPLTLAPLPALSFNSDTGATPFRRPLTAASPFPSMRRDRSRPQDFSEPQQQVVWVPQVINTPSTNILQPLALGLSTPGIKRHHRGRSVSEDSLSESSDEERERRRRRRERKRRHAKRSKEEDSEEDSKSSQEKESKLEKKVGKKEEEKQVEKEEKKVETHDEKEASNGTADDQDLETVPLPSKRRDFGKSSTFESSKATPKAPEPTPKIPESPFAAIFPTPEPSLNAVKVPNSFSFGTFPESSSFSFKPPANTPSTFKLPETSSPQEGSSNKKKRATESPASETAPPKNFDTKTTSFSFPTTPFVETGSFGTKTPSPPPAAAPSAEVLCPVCQNNMEDFDHSACQEDDTAQTDTAAADKGGEKVCPVCDNNLEDFDHSSCKEEEAKPASTFTTTPAMPLFKFELPEDKKGSLFGSTPGAGFGFTTPADPPSSTPAFSFNAPGGAKTDFFSSTTTKTDTSSSVPSFSFTSPATSTTSFGSSFGSTTSSFGSTSTFGSTSFDSSTSSFGTTTFDSSTTAPSLSFGATTTSFGASTTTTGFATSTTTPGFGTSTTLGFGASTTPNFGTSTTTLGFGSSTAPSFPSSTMESSSPAAASFGSGEPAFSFNNPATTSNFGASSFSTSFSTGAATTGFTAPNFGSSFGGSTASPPSFSFSNPSPSTSTFGSTFTAPSFGEGNAFGASQPFSGGSFGQPSAPAASPFGGFGAAPSTFGTPAAPAFPSAPTSFAPFSPQPPFGGEQTPFGGGGMGGMGGGGGGGGGFDFNPSGGGFAAGVAPSQSKRGRTFLTAARKKR